MNIKQFKGPTEFWNSLAQDPIAKTRKDKLVFDSSNPKFNSIWQDMLIVACKALHGISRGSSVSLSKKQQGWHVPDSFHLEMLSCETQELCPLCRSVCIME